MKKAKVTYKEFGSDRVGTTEYIGENITRQFIIDFYGLNKPDVDSYTIEIEDI